MNAGLLKRGLLWAVLPLLAAGGGYWVGKTNAAPAPMPSVMPALVTPVPEAAAEPVRNADSIMLTVAGRVRSPGTYTLPEDARVQDAVEAAGGVAGGAVLANINIAARLIDGSVLTVPAAGEEAADMNPAVYTRTGWQSTPTADGASAAVLDLNTATSSELESLPGVGPVTAGRIIEFRQHSRFERVEDLTQIRGIGEKTLESLRPHVIVH